MATPKKGGYRMVSDYRQVNRMVEKVPSHAESGSEYGQAESHHVLRQPGYAPKLLANAASTEFQDLFTISTPMGLYTPTRVPQGVLNATAYFQATMTELLHGLNCLVWADDVICWREDADDLSTHWTWCWSAWKMLACVQLHTDASLSTSQISGAGKCIPEARSSTIGNV